MKKASIILSFILVLSFLCTGCNVGNVKAPGVELFGISFQLTTSPVKEFLDKGYVLSYEGQKVDATTEVEKLMDLGEFTLSNGEKEATVNLVNLKEKPVALGQCSISAISYDFQKNNDDFKIKDAAFSKGMNKDGAMTALEDSGIKRGTEILESTDIDVEQTVKESDSTNESADEIEKMFDFDVPEVNMVKYAVLKAQYDFGEEEIASCRIYIDEETDTIAKMGLSQVYAHDLTGARD